MLKSFKSCLVWGIKLLDFFFKVNFWNISINVFMKYSALQVMGLNLKYWPHSFWPSPPPNKKTLNLSDPSLYEKPPSKFCRTWLPPWYVPQSKKAKTHFLKKEKILFATMKWEQIWTSKYEYTVAKSTNQWRVRLLPSILFLLGS